MLKSLLFQFSLFDVPFLSYFAFQFHIIPNRKTNIYSLLIHVAFAKQTAKRTISFHIHNQQFFKPFCFPYELFMENFFFSARAENLIQFRFLRIVKDSSLFFVFFAFRKHKKGFAVAPMSKRQRRNMKKGNHRIVDVIYVIQFCDKRRNKTNF